MQDDIDEDEDYDKKMFYKECKNYNYLPTILPAVKRIVVIGDLHGDYELTFKTLLKAEVINAKMEWIGGDTVVVQTGDQIDRCRPYKYSCDHILATKNDEASDIKILRLFTKLHDQALKKGGGVYSLLGNHELMNVLGNLNYVSHKGLEEFQNYKDPTTGLIIADGKAARKYAFSPGNELAKFLGCTRISALIVGSFLFVHAGILPEATKILNINSREALIKINYLIRKWLLGLINKDFVDKIIESSEHSFFWNRILGNIPPNVNNNDERCLNYLAPILRLFKVNSMIIGHTPQAFSHQKGINSTCDQKLWRIDSGSSKAFNDFDENYKETGEIMELRHIQLLEIINDSKINIIK